MILHKNGLTRHLDIDAQRFQAENSKASLSKKKSGLNPVVRQDTDSNVFFDQQENQIMENASFNIPVFMIPCRIETRIFSNQLKIRIYPDQIAIDSHQRQLTKEEMLAGKDYINDEDKLAAWLHLTKTYKPGRAAWIVKEAEAHSQTAGSLEDVYEYRDPDSPHFPKLKLLPKFFLVSLHLDTGTVIRIVGKPIQSDALDIINFSKNDTDNTLDAFTEGASWFAYFDKAIEKGMAVSVDLDLLKGAKVINKITVVGIRPKGFGVENGKTLLNNIFESHHYAKGVNFIRHGTPTNNTEEEKAGFTKKEDLESRFNREFLDGSFPSQCVSHLSRMLCLDQDLLCKWENREQLSSSVIEAFHKAIWSSTGGYYLNRFFQKNVEESNRASIQDHFVKFVRPLGFFPSIHIGKIPYGILPVTRFCYSSEKEEYADLEASLKAAFPNCSSELIRFYYKFIKILKNLSELWLKAATSDQVPHISNGSSGYTMEEQISRILAMSPESQSYVMRRYNDHNLSDFIISLGGLFYDQDESVEFNQERLNQIQKFQDLICNLIDESANPIPLLAFIENFGIVRNNPFPLVRNPSVSSESSGDPKADGPENYFLSLSNNQTVQTNTLLGKLLQRGKAFANQAGQTLLGPFDNAIFRFLSQFSNKDKLFKGLTVLDERLQDPNLDHNDPGLSNTANLFAERFIEINKNENDIVENVFLELRNEDEKLRSFFDSLYKKYILRYSDTEFESLLKSVLDIFSFRLDAWISSMANLKLMGMRAEQNGLQDEILVGAYGYVENLRLHEKDPGNRGFIHAPSLDQAKTAAILKNAFDHHDEYEINPCRLNISSDRIRRSLIIMEGLRAEIELGALLGYQFERMLHDRNKDHYKDEFRILFPFKTSNSVENVEEGDTSNIEPDENAVPRMVVDGLRIIEEYTETHADQDVNDAVDHLKDTMDAVNDLMTHEAIYQAVRSNYERAGAALDVGSGEGFPLEPESVSIALPHKKTTHRLCLTFDTAVSPTTDASSPREIAEPKIAKWFSTLLGKTARISCHVKFTKMAADNSATGSHTNVSIDDLNVRPVDFLYLCANRPGGGASELESRIKEVVRANYDGILEDDEHPITIDFDHASKISMDGSGGKVLSMGDAIELSRQTLIFLGQSSYLKPDQLYKQQDLSEREIEPLPPAFTTDDFEEVGGRIKVCYERFSTLVSTMQSYIPPLKIVLIYKEVHDSLLNEIKSLFRANKEDTALSDKITDGLVEYLGSYLKISVNDLGPIHASISGILTMEDPPDDYNPENEIYALVDQKLLGCFCSKSAISSLVENPVDLEQAIEQVMKSQIEAFLPHIETLRAYGFSIDFCQQFTPDSVITIFDSANERLRKAKACYDLWASWIPWPQRADTGESVEGSSAELIERVMETAKVLFGESFVILPTFDTPTEIEPASRSQAVILNGQCQSRVYQWMQQAAQTHARIQQLEDFLLFTDVWLGAEISCRFEPLIITLPMRPLPEEPWAQWQALSNEELNTESNRDRPKGVLNLALFSQGVQVQNRICGLHIESWGETLPFEEVDTAIAFQADTPNQQSANCCLIATPGDKTDESGFWNLIDLEAIVCDTMDLAKIRGVDLDAMPDMAGLLPAIFMPEEPEQDNTANWAAMADKVLQACTLNMEGVS